MQSCARAENSPRIFLDPSPQSHFSECAKVSQDTRNLVSDRLHPLFCRRSLAVKSDRVEIGLGEEMSFEWEVTGQERCHWGKTGKPQKRRNRGGGTGVLRERK